MTEHRMMPGSHERPGGPECACGAEWHPWYGTCAAQEAERRERMAPVLDRIPGIWGKTLPMPGWDGLLLELDAELAAIDPGYEIHQAKEKFGSLRFYIHSELSWEDMAPIIRRYEERSMVTCEVCGAPGVARTGGWIKTLCEEHAEGRQ